MTDIPRRIRIDLMTPTELAIHQVIGDIERMPNADVRLTNAQAYLAEAQRQFAAFVDDEEAEHWIQRAAKLQDEITTLRAQLEAVTRERDDECQAKAVYRDEANNYRRKYLAEREKVRRLVECVRKISQSQFMSDMPSHERLPLLLATVADITAPLTDEVG